MVTIRPARPADQPLLLELMSRLGDFPVPSWRTAQEIADADRRLLLDCLGGSMPDAVILVAEASPGASPAGYLFATTRHDYFTGAAHAHVEALVVGKAEEGRGVARALMDGVEQWARGRGHAWVTLNVFDRNTRAREIYEHLGYEAETRHYRKAL
jgi:ribosomal protein S18 acetylase RimI-like enzyme